MRLLTDEVDRESYRRDETALPRAAPADCGGPCADRDRLVAELVRRPAHRVPVVPRGAGTGLSGERSVSKAASRSPSPAWTGSSEIDRENLVVITQPGVINANLKKVVAAEGLFLRPDPASYETCTIGGNLGTSAGGLCCVKYGVTRDSVVGLEIVTADGSDPARRAHDQGRGRLRADPAHRRQPGALWPSSPRRPLRLRPTPPPKATLISFFPSSTPPARRSRD